MAVATRTAPVSVGRSVRSELTTPVYRRHRKRRNVVMSRTAICIIGVLLLLSYIGLHAQVTYYGYLRFDLDRQLRQLETENQALRAEIEMLSSPEQLSAIALAAGMQPSESMVYIAPTPKVTVAKAD